MVKRVIEEIQSRCRTLGLGVDPQSDDTRENFEIFLTAQTMKYVLQGRHREWL